MEYYFDEAKAGGKHLLLLHGTGGDEHSLVDIARFLDDACGILSFRGEVVEDGMNRFFKRNGLNQFDLDSLAIESERLLTAIESLSEEKGIPLEDWVLVGYSNGANIAAHLLLEKKTNLQQAILFHPMSLGVHTQDFSLEDKKVWLSYGAEDPIVSPASFAELKEAFETRGGQVTVASSPLSHQITMEEVRSAKAWLATL